MGALIVQDDVLRQIKGKVDKYAELVWYARRPPADHLSWNCMPPEIKRSSLDHQARIQEMLPGEIDALCSEHGDWYHGFNSGVVAALRFVLQASVDPEKAEEQFPDLEV